MKILQVCPKFHHSVASGSTKVAYCISKELARRGHLVTVYTSDMKDKYTRINHGVEEKDGVRVHRFQSVGTIATREMKIFVTPTIIPSLKNEAYSFDVIHVHEYRSFQSVVHHYAKKHGVPYILQAHGSLPRSIGAWRKLKWIYDVLFGYRLLSDASKVIALSRIEAERYRGMGVPEEKVAVIPNGIDLSEYVDLPPKGSFKKKFSIDEKEKIILYLGRIHRIKGIDILLKAFAAVIGKLGDVKLVVAGPDDGYLRELQALTKALKIEDNVLIPGPLYSRSKLEAYVDADVYVLPSRYETFPMGLLEAYSCGKPVIASRVGGLKDLVIDKVTGLSVEPGGTKQLANSIRYLLNNDDKAEEMGLRGKQFVKKNFAIEKVVDRLARLYEGIIDNKAHRTFRSTTEVS